MDDKDLWPVHFVALGVLAAIILFGLKEMLAGPPILLIASVALVIGLRWLIARR